MYDSHPDNCAGTNDDGVGRRPLSRLYDKAESVMYSQLANSSWRSSEPGALEDAEDAYSTNCQTPFTRLWFDMSSTSKFFCSKLVWRIYLDNDDHSVDLGNPGSLQLLSLAYTEVLRKRGAVHPLQHRRAG